MCRRGCCSTLGAYKLRTFLLTFFSYVSFHVTRKVFSVIKSNLSDAKWFGAAGDTGAKLGLLDGLFLFAYAVGLFVAGACGDNFPLVRVLLAGMWASGLVVIAFGVLGFMDVHALWAYAALWTVNGLVQATGWPANVAVMGNWFGRSERGAVLGLWSANASVGNIVGTAVAALLISVIGASAGWKWSMVAAGGIIIIEGAAVLAWLVPHPTRLGFPDPNAVSDTTDSEASGLLNSVKKAPDPVDVDALPAISVLDAWRIPGVLAYALSYACLKSANYACFFWLPLFLHNRYGMSDSQSDLVSMLYDAGQVVGGYVAGAITDRMGVRSPVAIVMMLMSAATVYLFNGASELRSEYEAVQLGDGTHQRLDHPARTDSFLACSHDTACSGWLPDGGTRQHDFSHHLCGLGHPPYADE